jgi:molybdate transport system ATP-binding protein
MTLSVDVRHRFGDFTLAAAFDSPPGLTALFGASGAGKTSLMRLIAGLARPAQGRVAVGGEVLVDTSSNVFLPPHRRGIGYVFQEARLLPHLSVRRNLEYAHWFNQRRNAPAAFDHIVELLGVGALLDRSPNVLSGGEAQRVAIGRALLTEPRLLLLDEPLASIDEPRRAEILPYLERLRDEVRIPIVYVSHALDEVLRLATTLIVLDAGKVAAAGDLSEVLGRVDLNILARRADAGVVLNAEIVEHDAQWQLTRLQCQAGTLLVPRVELPIGAKRRLWVRARDVALATERPVASSIVNVLEASVVELAGGDGASMDVQLDCNGAALLSRITRLSADRLGLRPGLKVYALVKGIALRSS